MRKSLLKALLVIAIIYSSAFPSVAFATPTLGVATDTGIYAYTDPSALTDEYINYFADVIQPAIDELEGFVIGPSPCYLTIFTSYNPSTIPIYLLTNAPSDNFPITFISQNLVSMGDTGQADGYKPYPYYGTQLPSSGWYTHTFEQSKLFYLYDGQLNYSGSIGVGSGTYFFAAAETNGTSGLQFAGRGGPKDDFSPKTTSAGGHIPEPASILLFRIGILGFGVFRKKIL